MVSNAANDNAYVAMDRRDFFKTAVKKLSKTAVKMLNEKLEKKSTQWLRPPYALPELDFLLACTRCNKCIEACPYGVIFPLSAKLGIDIVATPALDLLNKACHLCDDWPCVEQCESDALKYPETEDGKSIPLPKLAYVEINEDLCLPYIGPECGACAASCPVPSALSWDAERPVVVAEKCIGCGLCREACIVSPKAVRIRSLASVITADQG